MVGACGTGHAMDVGATPKLLVLARSQARFHAMVEADPEQSRLLETAGQKSLRAQCPAEKPNVITYVNFMLKR